MTTQQLEFRNFKAVFPGAIEDMVNITGFTPPDNVNGTTAYPTVRGFFKMYRDIYKRCAKTQIQQEDVRDFCRYIDAKPISINDDQLRRLGPVFFRIASTIVINEDE